MRRRTLLTGAAALAGASSLLSARTAAADRPSS